MKWNEEPSRPKELTFIGFEEESDAEENDVETTYFCEPVVRKSRKSQARFSAEISFFRQVSIGSVSSVSSGQKTISPVRRFVKDSTGLRRSMFVTPTAAAKLESARLSCFQSDNWISLVDDHDLSGSDLSEDEGSLDACSTRRRKSSRGSRPGSISTISPMPQRKSSWKGSTGNGRLSAGMWDTAFQTVVNGESLDISTFELLGGFVLDFVPRAWRASQAANMPSIRKDLDAYIDCIAQREGNSPESRDENEHPIFKELARHASDERLTWLVMEDVTIFRKQSCHESPWRPCDSQVFSMRARELVTYARKKTILRCTVNEFIEECRAGLKPRVLKEGLEDRHQRHQSFWKQFHVGPRKFELVPDVEPARRSPAQLERPRSVPDLKQIQPCWKSRPSRTGDSPAKHKKPSIFQMAQNVSGGCERSSSAPHGSRRARDEERPASASDSSMRRKRGAITNFQAALMAAENKEKYPDFSVATRPAKPIADLLGAINPGLCPKHLVSQKKAVSSSLVSDSRRTSRISPAFSGRNFSGIHKTQEEGDSLSDEDADLASKGLISQRKKTALMEADWRFTSPWHSGGGVAVWHAQTNPGKYLRSCHGRGILPKTLPFMTGHSTKLQARGAGLNDHDLISACSMSVTTGIEEIDLGDNASLSDKAVVGFLAHLVGTPLATSALQRISLNGCRQLGAETVDKVTRLLSDTSSNLQHLDISGISLGTKYVEPFTRAIQGSPSLRVLKLADTGLNNINASEILRNQTVETLDLSWNCFTSEVFRAMGQRVVENQQLKFFSLSNCSALWSTEDDGTIVTPIVCFIEHLAWDRQLKSLDLSMNRLDFRGCLVIEDALEHHSELSELNVSSNPLGFPGARNLLRLMSRQTSGLVHVTAEHCDVPVASQSCVQDERSTNSGEAIFHMCNPAGRYDLNLASPCHRAVLRMLCKICDCFQFPPDGCFSHLQYSMPPYAHPSKDAVGIWQVPNKGRLRAKFNIEPAMVAAFQGLEEDRFGSLLNRFFDRVRVRPSLRKFCALSAHWKKLWDRPSQQEVFLNAISRDISLTCSEVSELATSHDFSGQISNIPDVVAALVGNVIGGKTAQYLLMLQIPSMGQYINVATQAHCLFYHNIENPTAHYVLNLANPCDYSVAEDLMIIEQWEIGVEQRSSRPDTSQCGNRSHFRNVTYNQQLLNGSPSEWIMPESGIFAFDYVSNSRPKPGARELDKLTFINILIVLSQAECASSGSAHALKQVSHQIYLKSKQLREVIGILGSESVRGDAFVSLILRITDIWNSKVFRVCFGDANEIIALQRRLGSATFFPFIQPEQFHFEFDFAFHDQRLAANLICVLNAMEGGGNLRNYTYIHQDGTQDSLIAGVPRMWEKHNECPKEGVFRAVYLCAPENRNFKFRRNMLTTYGGWAADVAESDIMWWASLVDVPDDVISYLHFLITRYPSLNHVYGLITRGTGEITLRSLEHSIKKMNCKKFRGPNESERIKSIFRFLDDDNHGSVSKGEWEVLEMLRKEIDMSVEEFKVFLHRTFHGNLCLAWDYFDSDQSGEIDLEEWKAAVRRLGYFGDVVHTFHYIDLDDTGTVGWEEFETMWDRLDS